MAFTTNFQHDKITYRMKPVSVVIISPGTTRVADAFLEPESDTCFRKVGNLMSAAMLQQWMLFVALVDDVMPLSCCIFKNHRNELDVKPHRYNHQIYYISTSLSF